MFKALPLKQYEADPKKKLTRKLQSINREMKEIYPGEGHVNVKLSDNQYMFFGGTSRSSEASWPDASSISILETSVTKDDVSIENILSPKVVGGQFPPLQGSAAMIDHNHVYVWGGLNLSSFSFSNELSVLDTTLLSRGRIDVEIVQDTYGISKRHMYGDVPSGRSGHSMTFLSRDCVVMFGGVRFPHRESANITVSPFAHFTDDEHFYVLNIDDLTWQQLPITSPSRAYHTATLLSLNNVQSVLIVGGFFKSTHFFRYTIDNMPLLSKYSDQGFVLECVTANQCSDKRHIFPCLCCTWTSHFHCRRCK